jgi:hypothetical protein
MGLAVSLMIVYGAVIITLLSVIALNFLGMNILGLGSFGF